MSAHELDHVAFAVPAWQRPGELLHRELGARFASGFTLPAFNPCQLALAGDMRLELLEPGSSPASFVSRFLSENAGNAAPHHITFKVQDISAAIALAQEAGIEPILVNLGHPLWREAFLHPKDTGLGFLTQMVQTSEPLEGMGAGNEFTAGCPWEESPAPQAGLPVIYGLVGDLQRAEHILVDVLGAEGHRIIADSGGEPAAKVFRWPNGADLILQESADDAGPSGLKALGFTAADEPWAGADYPGMLETLRAGPFYPELGIRISPVHISAPASPG